MTHEQSQPLRRRGKEVDLPDLKQKIAVRGSYSRAMSPSETIAFVAAEQRKWTPVLEHIGKKSQ
jgi:hypothetical protein